eukprot:TRINITY_DN18448_c0_g1_i1.p1 TRINITY_DN18448_c0_g1~~TRINITY_DN18448_c0_g1_i1.p1  ORF type:complete len:353 (+),score=109.99 TRINITY_DN18448_c0_g1_i1:94-1152(+)
MGAHAAGTGPLGRVRESCIALQPAEVALDTDAVQAFVRDVDPAAIAALDLSQELCHFAVQFGSALQEVSFVAVAHALDFGSGFRKPLHAFHGKGAWMTVKPGLERMHGESPELPADWLAGLGIEDVERFFLPGLLSSEEGAVRSSLEELLRLFLAVCRELGEGLRRRGMRFMHQLVLGAIHREAEAESCGGPANAVVQELVTAFPYTFDDRYMYGGVTPVYLYKKAQLVTGELYHRFRGRADLQLDFADAAELTAYVDNVIVATMRRTGCIRPAAELAADIEAGRPVPRGSGGEIALRAKALHAVELIAQGLAARGHPLKPCEVGNYLWAALGKQPEFRQYERHATPDTCFY